MNTTSNNNMIHTDPKFIDTLQGLQSFIQETDADIDFAYDWVSDQIGISSFVDDNKAWDMFYEIYESATA